MGVKPFFYAERDGGFIFGSELKAILAHPDVKTEIDREGLSEVFGVGPSRKPGSGVFHDIQELRPAHALTLSRKGLRIWRYWNVKSEEHRDTLDETAEKVRFLVEDAVTRQLVSDVPLCTFLSGGLDSSAITAIAANAYQKKGKASFIRIPLIMRIMSVISRQMIFSQTPMGIGLKRCRIVLTRFTIHRSSLKSS